MRGCNFPQVQDFSADFLLDLFIVYASNQDWQLDCFGAENRCVNKLYVHYVEFVGIANAIFCLYFAGDEGICIQARF